MKNRNSRMSEIAFHTLFCMVSMVSILQCKKKYTSENDPLQAQITMREFQFFESIIEKHSFFQSYACFDSKAVIIRTTIKKKLFLSIKCRST
jgi:hypothetical protein